MKVLLLNGSPHIDGCTYTALSELAKTLKEENIDSEIFQLGKDLISGCRGCGACGNLGHCVIKDKVNDFLEKAKTADGFVFGSAVHYASATGSITSFLDRAFYINARSHQGIFEHKPGAIVVSARRSGTTATIDQLNKYFMITQMPIISGRYWNMVHGRTPEDVKKDFEGLQNLRFLARNMAWHLKCQEAGKKAGILPSSQEPVIMTDFIR